MFPCWKRRPFLIPVSGKALGEWGQSGPATSLCDTAFRLCGLLPGLATTAALGWSSRALTLPIKMALVPLRRQQVTNLKPAKADFA